MSRATQKLILAWLACSLPIVALAQNSPFIDGRTADMWVVDPATGQLTGYDTSRWMQLINPADTTGIALGATAVLLINKLPNSSLPMTAGQPAISLAGIGDAALFAGEGAEGGHRNLTILPASGDFSDTIAVNIGVSTALLTGGAHQLTWSVVETVSGATVLNDSVMLAQGAGGTGQNGYYRQTFYLVNNGDYLVSARLQGATVDTTVARNYDLAIAADKARRDTDGDGIPDAVEVDMGLNPLKDDLLADTDGNGWTQFDEWLRRYCLDPNTLQPLDGAAPCLDANGVPLDSDDDNWSDFDEILRSTNHLDPEPVILEQVAAPGANQDDPDPPPVAEPAEPGSEYVERQRLRYKDFPAAKRLYEVEHLINAGTGVLSVPPIANVLLDQQSIGPNSTAYTGIVVQSYTAANDNITGVDFRVSAGGEGVEDIILNIWADSLRDGTLLLSRRIEDVVLDGDPDRPIVVRFEPVAVQAGQQVFFEFRKKNAALVSTGADTLGGGGVIEIDGVTVAATSDLVLDVFYDANFANGIGGTRAGMQWWTIAAAGLDGSLAYDATLLLRDNDISAAGLSPTDISSRRRMTTLALALGGSQLPELRLPAGDSVVVSAVHRHHVPNQEGWRAPADYSRIYKRWLPRTDDITPTTMLAEMGEGSWTTPEEWRREFISYLVPRVVVPLAVTLDESSTLEVAAMEAALSEEARLDGSDGLMLLNGIFQPSQPIYVYDPGQAIFGDLLSHQSPYIDHWEDNLTRLSAGNFNLDQSIVEVRSALGPGQPLNSLGQWLRQRFHAGIPGTSSDKYMAQQFLIAFPDVCKVPTAEIAVRQADVDGWNEFLDQCPAWVDDAGFEQYLEDMRDRCYAVRLNLLPGATLEIGGDASLLDRSIDSDADGAINQNEIEVPVPALTLPWLFDSDGDSIADSVDPCPNDPYNDCSANPIRPNVTMDGDFEVFEPNTGIGFALVSIHLDRLYDVPVTVCYEAIMDLGDTATPDVDYEAVTGCVTIEPGQLSALIEIPINADAELDAGETFTVNITSITNGSIGDDGRVVVTLNDPAPVDNTAPVFTSASSISAASGNTETGYTATAIDAEGDTLTFSTSGGADQAQFSVDPDTGVLSFVVAPDFNAPADADGDNDYEVQLMVDDGNAGTDTLDLIVSVVDVSLAIEITYPTYDANLGGDATTTTVTGNIVDPLGNPIDLADIATLDVNLTAATLDASNPGRWSVQVPVVRGENTLAVAMELSNGTIINIDQPLQNFSILTGLESVVFDGALNRLIALDFTSVGRIVSVDLASGERALVSGDGVGAGIAFDSIRDIALDAANNRVLVVDWQRDALVAVNLSTGDRNDVSRGAVGSGIALDGPLSVALDSLNNRALVTISNGDLLIAVDLASGDRLTVSGGGVGAGPAFGSLRHVAYDNANSRALVSDSNLDAIIAVDLGTGDRTIVSNGTTGTGATFSSPENIKLDASSNRLLVSDLSRGFFSVDLANGNRTVLTDPGLDYGRNGSRPGGIALDLPNNRAFLSDSAIDAIFAVDLMTGDRTVILDHGTGSGATIANLYFGRGLALDRNHNRLLLTSANSLSVTAIDLATADRSIFSAIGNTPGRVVVDEATDRAALNIGPTLLELDLNTGNRTFLSHSGIGTGPNFVNIWNIAADFANNRATVLDSSGLLSVAIDTGDRSIVSDAATGGGPLWTNPRGLEINAATGTGYISDLGTTALYSVDMTTGNRAILSNNSGIGTGPMLGNMNDSVLDLAAGQVLVADSGAFGVARGIKAVNLSNGDRVMIWDGSALSYLSPELLSLDRPNNRLFVYSTILSGIFVIELSSGEWAVMSK